MGKYSPLADYLRGQKRDEVPMTFAKIEKLVGKLPNSHQYRAWWSNNDFNSAMTKAWLDAGFRSEQVDMGSRKLVFRKITPAETRGRSTKRAAVSKRHPLFGALKGTVSVVPGYDLMEPALPEWGEVAYGDKTWDDFK